MNYIDVFYQSDDGLRLYARDYPGPAPHTPVILCLPGLTRNSKDFAELANSLQQRYRVICPDQRGRGRSARDVDASHYNPGQYALDMRTLLNLLHIPEVAVIGTSLGGMMAMLMIASDPARIKAAVLNDIGPEIDPRGVARIAGYVGKTAPASNWDEAAQQTALTNGAAFPDFTSKEWRAMSHDLYVQEGTVPVLDYDPAIAQGLAAGTATPNLWPLFEMIREKPMLVVRGEVSDILSFETLAEMSQRLPQMISLTVPRRGHAPTLREPEAHAAISQFLVHIYPDAKEQP
jgi:pimeloyl-ACP methyl ester carboxylesterase